MLQIPHLATVLKASSPAAALLLVLPFSEEHHGSSSNHHWGNDPWLLKQNRYVMHGEKNLLLVLLQTGNHAQVWVTGMSLHSPNLQLFFV